MQQKGFLPPGPELAHEGMTRQVNHLQVYASLFFWATVSHYPQYCKFLITCHPKLGGQGQYRFLDAHGFQTFCTEKVRTILDRFCTASVFDAVSVLATIKTQYEIFFGTAAQFSNEK